MFLTLRFPWPRSELTIQAPNDFGLDLKVPWEQLLVRKRFIRVAENEVGPIGRWTRAAKTKSFSSKIILATNEDRAIDLSCRACGAGAWALGLDSRWGSSASLRFSPPTSDRVKQTQTREDSCKQSSSLYLRGTGLENGQAQH